MAIPYKQVGLTAGATAVAAAAIVGAWGAWSTGDANDQATRSGVLDLDFSAASFATPLGTEASPIVAGDSGCRSIALVNDGNVDLINTSVHVNPTLTEGNYVDTSGDGANAIDETLTSVDSDFTDNLDVSITRDDAVDQLDSAGITVPGCGAIGADVALAVTSLSSIDTLGEAALVDFSDSAAAGVFANAGAGLDSQSVVYAALAYALDAATPETAQNVYGNLEWVFAADQRVAVTNK
jgi:hypothetical protein